MADYFVSYFFKEKNKNTGHGQTNFINASDFMCAELLGNIRENIEKSNNFEAVILTNVIKLEQPPTETV